METTLTTSRIFDSRAADEAGCGQALRLASRPPNPASQGIDQPPADRQSSSARATLPLYSSTISSQVCCQSVVRIPCITSISQKNTLQPAEQDGLEIPARTRRRGDVSRPGYESAQRGRTDALRARGGQRAGEVAAALLLLMPGMAGGSKPQSNIAGS